MRGGFEPSPFLRPDRRLICINAGTRKCRRRCPSIDRDPGEWTIAELARHIPMPEPTLYTRVQRGRQPHSRGQWPVSAGHCGRNSQIPGAARSVRWRCNIPGRISRRRSGVGRGIGRRIRGRTEDGAGRHTGGNATPARSTIVIAVAAAASTVDVHIPGRGGIHIPVSGCVYVPVRSRVARV